jgi:enoyl-CoA hydratase/carnithine racemase
MFSEILYAVEDGIATITLNRPEKLNAFTNTMRLELIAAFDRIDADDEVRVVIVTGAGRAFCAGQDLVEAASMTLEHVSRLFNHLRGIYLAMRDLTKGCVAALNGVAVGEGFQFALCADQRIGHPGVRVGLPEVGLGLAPVLGAHLLGLHSGYGLTLELVLSGALIEGQRAYDLGLLSALVEEEDVLPSAIAAAEQMASRPKLAVRQIKRRYRDITKAGFDAACEAGLQSAVESYSKGEPQAAMRAFLQARGKGRCG